MTKSKTKQTAERTSRRPAWSGSVKGIKGQYLLMREHVMEIDRLKAALRSCILALERINLDSTEIMDRTESRVPTEDIERGNRAALKGRRAISPNA